MNYILLVIALIFSVVGCDSDSSDSLPSASTKGVNSLSDDYSIIPNITNTDRDKIIDTQDSDNTDDSDNNPYSELVSLDVSGVITSFGSLYIDGLHLEIPSDIKIFYLNDSNPMSLEDLDVGMVVDAEGVAYLDENGDLVDAKLSSVSYSEQICGSIDSIDTVNKYFVVMGLKVFYDSNTSFYGLDLNTTYFDLYSDDHVSVSGFYNKEGDLIATRVARKENDYSEKSVLKLSGVIEDLQVNSSEFKLNNIMIDYQNADNTPPFMEGDYVLVKGSLLAGVFNAIEIVPISKKKSKSKSKIHSKTFKGFEGLVRSADLEQNNFMLNGVSVSYSDKTKIKYGEQESLVDGAHVRVLGHIKEDVLIAKSIVISQLADKEFEGIVTDFKKEGDNYIIEVGDGVMEFVVDNLTKIKDKGDRSKRDLRKKDAFKKGDVVTISGFKNKLNNKIHASKVNRIKMDDSTISSLYNSNINKISPRKTDDLGKPPPPKIGSKEYIEDYRGVFKLKGKITSISDQYVVLDEDMKLYFNDDTRYTGFLADTISSIDDFVSEVKEMIDLGVFVYVYAMKIDGSFVVDSIRLSNFKDKNKEKPPSEDDKKLDRKPFMVYGFLDSLDIDGFSLSIRSKNDKDPIVFSMSYPELIQELNYYKYQKIPSLSIHLLTKDSTESFTLDNLKNLDEKIKDISQDFDLMVKVKGYKFLDDVNIATEVVIYKDNEVLDNFYSRSRENENSYRILPHPHKGDPKSKNRDAKPIEKSFVNKYYNLVH